MFSPGEARCDRWQDLAHAAQTLVARAAAGSSTEETLTAVRDLLKPLSVLETFRAFPGEAMMSALKEALAREDYSGFSRIAKSHREGHHHRLLSPLGQCLESWRGKRVGKQRAFA